MITGFSGQGNMASDWNRQQRVANRFPSMRPPQRLMASSPSLSSFSSSFELQQRRAVSSIARMGHQSRFHIVLCLVLLQMITSSCGAEFVTAGIAGGGPRFSINTPQKDQSSTSLPATEAAVLRIVPSDSLVNSSTSDSISISTNQRTVPAAAADQGSAKDAFRVTWSALKYVNKADQGKKRFEKKSTLVTQAVDLGDWQCPNITQNANLECGCDMPHTLRCRGDLHGLELIAEGLRTSRYTVSLLDCTLKNVTVISDANIFEGVSLQGLVISSGEIKRINRMSFAGITNSLQTLGLPNNALTGVPMQALISLPQLDRLDLSNNKIKSIQSTDFISVPKLSFLELSENQISSIAPKSFIPVRNLIHLKLNGNRLGESPESMKSLEACLNLRELDLRSNTIRGPLTNSTLPIIKGLEILKLDKNSITSIQNGALEQLAKLQMLSLRHNQIDVLQDHAFSGLASLQVLDLGQNGIVAISGSSLKHLPRLIVLDLTHNFLRALTSDIVAPLPSLKELRLDGNDISIIAQNALQNTSSLHSLSLENNPLACDCSMKPFVEWLATSRIASQDILGAVCATPPHLEGASLLQIATESMNCNSASKDPSDQSTFKTIEVMLKLKNNMSYIREVSADVKLRSVNFTDESDVFLHWRMQTDEYSCRFVYVFHDDDPENILFNSEVSCIQLPELANATDYAFLTKLVGAFDLQRNLSYKFCLIMKEDISRDEYLGSCQVAVLPEPQPNRSKAKSIKKELYSVQTKPAGRESDISDLNRFAEPADRRYDDEDADDGTSNGADSDAYYDELMMTRMADDPNSMINRMRLEEAAAARLPSVGVSRIVLEGLGAFIVVTTLMAFIWGFIRLKSGRSHLPSMSTCYTVDDRRGPLHEIESRSRYFKLQATTSL